MKKALVGYDLTSPDAMGGLVVVWPSTTGAWGLVDAESGRAASHGMVVYTGQDLTPDHVLARLVHGNLDIRNVGTVLEWMAAYLDQVGHVRVGSVVRVRSVDTSRFELQRVGRPSRTHRQLP